MMLLRSDRRCRILSITGVTCTAGCIALLLRYRLPYANATIFQVLTCTLVILVACTGNINRLIIRLAESTSLQENQEQEQHHGAEYVTVEPHIISFVE